MSWPYAVVAVGWMLAGIWSNPPSYLGHVIACATVAGLMLLEGRRQARSWGRTPDEEDR